MNVSNKILIVDDDAMIAEYLKEILIELNYSNIVIAYSQSEAIETIKKFKPDVALLDIRLDKHTEGIDLAGIINNSYKIPFIYITAHSDKEIIHKAVQTKPLGYITKPYKNMDVYAALQLVNVMVPNSFEFKDGYTNIKLLCSEILFVKSDDKYIEITTADKRYTLRNSLEWFLNEIDSTEFVRVHRSYVVNKNNISAHTTKEILINNIKIPVSRGFKWG